MRIADSEEPKSNSSTTSGSTQFQAIQSPYAWSRAQYTKADEEAARTQAAAFVLQRLTQGSSSGSPKPRNRIGNKRKEKALTDDNVGGNEEIAVDIEGRDVEAEVSEQKVKKTKKSSKEDAYDWDDNWMSSDEDVSKSHSKSKRKKNIDDDDNDDDNLDTITQDPDTSVLRRSGRATKMNLHTDEVWGVNYSGSIYTNMSTSSTYMTTSSPFSSNLIPCAVVRLPARSENEQIAASGAEYFASQKPNKKKQIPQEPSRERLQLKSLHHQRSKEWVSTFANHWTDVTVSRDRMSGLRRFDSSDSKDTIIIKRTTDTTRESANLNAIQSGLTLPYSFGRARAFTLRTVYLKKSNRGVGLRVKKIDKRLVVRGFASWFDPSVDIRVNDVIAVANTVDARANNPDRMLQEFTFRDTAASTEKTAVGLSLVEEMICLQIARPDIYAVDIPVAAPPLTLASIGSDTKKKRSYTASLTVPGSSSSSAAAVAATENISQNLQNVTASKTSSLSSSTPITRPTVSVSISATKRTSVTPSVGASTEVDSTDNTSSSSGPKMKVKIKDRPSQNSQNSQNSQSNR
jgi:hypothetical protein